MGRNLKKAVEGEDVESKNKIGVDKLSISERRWML
jgi:hypothetical protein